MDKAVGYALKGLVAVIGILDVYLGRQGTEKILDATRAIYVAEGRPPSDDELVENVEVAKEINNRIQQA